MVGKFLVAVLAVTGVTAGVGIAASTSSSSDAVVTRIVDGDTIQATLDGRDTTVRLLNIDTPETEDPNVDVECLGPEAAARLAALLPVGTTVELGFDEERTDRYGRTLAGVYDPEGRLVNAELAREGLGAAMLVEPNSRFYDEVADAQEEARAAARGLHDPDVACTLPARVYAATDAVADLERQAELPSQDPAVLDDAARRTRAALDEVVALRASFTGPRDGPVWAVLSPDDDRRLTDALSSAETDARILYARQTLRAGWTGLAESVRERVRQAGERAEDSWDAWHESARQIVTERAEREPEPGRESETGERESRRTAPTSAAPDSAPRAVTAPAAAPSTGGAGGAGGGCDPNYRPCVPRSSTDLDCGDLSGGPFAVVGSDPHGLDGDSDGEGCESQG